MRAMRLRRTKDIELVREGGEVRSDRLFTMRARPNGLDVVRVAVASPRAVGVATRRNRARRRVREAIRTLLLARRGAPGTDLFVVARAPALDAPAAALRTAVAKQLDELLGAAR
ncbi:MAG: ribonuclease P protein component [Chloroflexi bacterium]|nr:ribonuclease P protein component [Chloroflexota bacterium]